MENRLVEAPACPERRRHFPSNRSSGSGSGSDSGSLVVCQCGSPSQWPVLSPEEAVEMRPGYPYRTVTVRVEEEVLGRKDPDCSWRSLEEEHLVP